MGALDLISKLQQVVAPKIGPGRPSLGDERGFDLLSTGSTEEPAAPTAPPSAPLAPPAMDTLLSVQDPSQLKEQLFRLLDVNNDGTLSKAELAGAVGPSQQNTTLADKIFGLLDANQDGGVSPDELNHALDGLKQRLQGLAAGIHRHHGQNGLASLLGGGVNGILSSLGNSQGGTDSGTDTGGSDTSVAPPVSAAVTDPRAAVAHHLMERLFDRQAKMLTATAPSLTIKA
jgi:Ca2+-binding EF-hand superfamily protein